MQVSGGEWRAAAVEIRKAPPPQPAPIEGGGGYFVGWARRESGGEIRGAPPLRSALMDGGGGFFLWARRESGGEIRRAPPPRPAPMEGGGELGKGASRHPRPPFVGAGWCGVQQILRTQRAR